MVLNLVARLGRGFLHANAQVKSSMRINAAIKVLLVCGLSELSNYHLLWFKLGSKFFSAGNLLGQSTCQRFFGSAVTQFRHHQGTRN